MSAVMSPNHPVSIDGLFNRQYDTEHYNCVHFLCDAWQHVTGQDLKQRMDGFLTAVSSMKASRQTMRGFSRLSAPVSPCIVLMKNRFNSHVGLFYQGRVLHLSEAGVQWMPLPVATFGFQVVRFYQ